MEDEAVLLCTPLLNICSSSSSHNYDNDYWQDSRRTISNIKQGRNGYVTEFANMSGLLTQDGYCTSMTKKLGKKKV